MKELIEIIKKTLSSFKKDEFKASVIEGGLFPTLFILLFNFIALIFILPIFIIIGPFYFFNEWSKRWFAQRIQEQSEEETRELLDWKMTK